MFPAEGDHDMAFRTHFLAATAFCLTATLAVQAEIPTPARPVTDPHAIIYPANPSARPVPIDDLAFSRGLLSAAWSADAPPLTPGWRNQP